MRGNGAMAAAVQLGSTRAADRKNSIIGSSTAGSVENPANASPAKSRPEPAQPRVPSPTMRSKPTLWVRRPATKPPVM